MSDVISDFFDRDALISLYKAQGWTSAEFARQAGLNKNMISRYERGLSTPRPAYITSVSWATSATTARSCVMKR